MKKIKEKINAYIAKLKNQILILYEVNRHPRTPILAKIMVVIIIGYALSPIDLIPDFIPIIGYLDDLIILPVLIFFTVKLIPNDIWIDCTIKAKKLDSRLPKNWKAAVFIICFWLLIVLFIVSKLS